MTGLVYGIDLGTTTSAVVVGRADGSSVRVRDPGSAHGSYAIPTSVCLTPDGDPVVGAAAERAKAGCPDRYYGEFKREFGVLSPVRRGGRSVRPHDLAAEVLRFLRAAAAAQVPGEPELTVITVPAAWEGGNRELMAGAAELAGFDPARVRLRPEPVAAAAYAVGGPGGAAGAAAGRTLVYDLGGGTVDCALAGPAAGGGFEVLGAPGGLQDVGAGAFDRLILGRLRREFPEPAAKLLDGAAVDRDTARRRLALLDACEQLKIQLSVARVHEVYLTEVDPPARFRMTRAELAELIRPLLRETVAECERLLGGLGLGWPEVDRIVPVGGSCRLPLVGELLARHSGRAVLPVDDPELAVAHGAALLARSLVEPVGSGGRSAAAPAYEYPYHPDKSPFERD